MEEHVYKHQMAVKTGFPLWIKDFSWREEHASVYITRTYYDRSNPKGDVRGNFWSGVII